MQPLLLLLAFVTIYIASNKVVNGSMHSARTCYNGFFLLLPVDIHALELLKKPLSTPVYIIPDDHEFLQIEILERLKKHLPGIHSVLNAEQDKAQLLLILQADSLFDEPQHIFLRIDKKPQYIQPLLAACLNSAHPVVVHGTYIKNLIKTKDYKTFTQANTTPVLVQTSVRGHGWFAKWLDWKIADLNLQLDTQVYDFLQKELFDAPLAAAQWLGRCAFFADITHNRQVTTDDLDTLTHYQKQQQAQHILHLVLTGQGANMSVHLYNMQQGQTNQVGLLLWLATQVIYQLIAMHTKDTEYNARVYVPIDAHTMRSLAQSVPLAKLHTWLAQLIAIDATRRGEATALWPALHALLYDMTRYAHTNN